MTITCPNCKTEFPLDERALAGHVESEVAKRVASARKGLVAEAERNARTAAAEEKDRALEALRASVGEYRDQLAAAHAAQTELRQELELRAAFPEDQRITAAQTGIDRFIGDIQGIAGIAIEELDAVPMPALVAVN